MSAANEIARFAKDLQANETFRAEVKSLGTDQGAILRLANAKGYQFGLADVEALGDGAELTDEQLAGVAGGSTILYTDGTTTLTGGQNIGIYKTTKSVLVW
jgi:predicted ribosomally synthesized peptide with nif11-like leader